MGSQSLPKNINDRILGIIFCEFHDTEGPKITFQLPDSIISKATFDTISYYIIPKTELKNRLITITIDNYRICGYPVYIENSKYPRMKYIYNTCFIFNKNTNTCSYEAVVKKLACDLKTLETECGFLSKNDTKTHLPELLEQIRLSLNLNGECVIQKIGNLEHSSLFLKLIQKHLDPQYVQSFDVPVFVTNLKSFSVDDWDLTTNKIFSTINGFRTVAKISHDTNIEVNVVKENIQNLIYANLVALVPLIQVSSIFVTTPKIAEFYSKKEIQNEACFFATLDHSFESPLFCDIFEIYSYFTQHGITVKEVNERHHPKESNIDLKKLILFGLIKGFLRKVNKYPFLMNEPPSNANNPSKYNGNHNFDKLCSGISLSELNKEIDSNPNLVVYYK